MVDNFVICEQKRLPPVPPPAQGTPKRLFRTQEMTLFS